MEKKEYEIGYMIKAADALAEIEKVLSSEQADVVNKSQPREMRLAYPVKKHTTAFFGFIIFKVMPEAIARMKKVLQLREGVLRFIIVKPASKKIAKQVASKEEKTNESPTMDVQLPRVLTNEALEEKLEEILK